MLYKDPQADMLFYHNAIEIEQLLLVIGISQRKHGPPVFNGNKFLGDIAANLLCGRIRVGIFRKLFFKIVKFLQLFIELKIGNTGHSKHIIVVVMLL